MLHVSQKSISQTDEKLIERENSALTALTSKTVQHLPKTDI